MSIDSNNDHPEAIYDATILQACTQLNHILELLRLAGVDAASRVGARDYSMSTWINPEKLALYNVTPQEVIAAIKDQSFEIAPGKFGETSDEVFETTLRHSGRFNLPEEYESLVIKTNEDGSFLFLRDIA